MKRKILLCMGFSLTFFVLPAFPDWQVIYSEDFSSAPGWTTNNPDNYHWDSAKQTYYANQVEGASEQDPRTHDYAYMPLTLAEEPRAWRFEFDFQQTAYKYPGESTLSLMDQDISWSIPSVCISLQFADSHVHLVWCDSTEQWAQVISPQTYELDVWYRSVVEWDADTSVLEARVIRMDSGVLFTELTASVPGPFSGIDRIGMGNPGWNPDPGMATGYFDNVVVSVPEPGTLSVFGLGGLAVMRKRRN
jgi:hypothetical protein